MKELTCNAGEDVERWAELANSFTTRSMDREETRATIIVVY